ncbi:hypothetical protein GA8_07325 [Geobacillus sp. A8]|nr:hypothetical protein GA8_07325 [Geobacillus sp. A8]
MSPFLFGCQFMLVNLLIYSHQVSLGFKGAAEGFGFFSYLLGREGREYVS